MKKTYFDLQKKVLQKTTNNQNWKLSQMNCSPKPKLWNSAHTKPVTLKLLLLDCFIFLSKTRKDLKLKKCQRIKVWKRIAQTQSWISTPTFMSQL